MKIRDIAMYLAWRLPPYYGKSNLLTFTKALRTISKEEYTNNEILFIQKLAKWIDDEFYFMILDDLDKEINKKDFYKILKKLRVPIELYNIRI